jgi:(1->4)-alpha-D-glucan 1-alpha-D-glucosylmutase
MREAKLHSSWTAPDPAYESAVQEFVSALLVDPEVGRLLAGWGERTAPAVRVTTLGQKLLQLVLPGAPDVFQGCESVALTLVDPDNRQPVDHGDLAGRLGALERIGAGGPGELSLADAKLLVTSRALRLRRDHPEWFIGPEATYAPVATTRLRPRLVPRRCLRSGRDRGDDPAVGVAPAVRGLGRAHGHPARLRRRMDRRADRAGGLRWPAEPGRAAPRPTGGPAPPVTAGRSRR